MARTISRAELARNARVSKPAITKWLKKHPGACAAGDRVDLDHPEVVAYLKSKGFEVPAAPVAPAAKSPASDAGPTTPKKPARSAPPAPPAPSKGVRRPQPEPTPPPPLEPPAKPAAKPSAAKGRRQPTGKRGPAPTPDAQGFVDELADLTLLQICERYGTVSAFKSHLEAFEKRERALKYRLENEEAEGRLVDREFVVRVVGAFDGSARKLLADSPKTIARRLYAMHAAEEPVEAAEATVHEIYSTILKAVKKAVHEVIDGD
jgi:hypothetical protein